MVGWEYAEEIDQMNTDRVKNGGCLDMNVRKRRTKLMFLKLCSVKIASKTHKKYSFLS